MNYQKIYDQLVKVGRYQNNNQGYHEIHHIIPKSLGGSNTKLNLVSFTAKQHYIAHVLLVKIAQASGDTVFLQKMIYALNCMHYGRASGNRVFKFNSRLYEKLKAKYAETRRTMMAGRNNVMSGKRWIFSFELEKSIVISKNDSIPEGWLPGRHSSQWFHKQKTKIQKQQAHLCKKQQMLEVKEHNAKIRSLIKQVAIDKKRQRIKLKEREFEKRLAEYRAMYEEFKQNGFHSVVHKFKYKKTRNNLLMLFKKYIPKYVPAVCNRWKNHKSV